MAQKENEQSAVEIKRAVASAPELPHEIAKQFDLHTEPHNRIPEADAKAETSSTDAERGDTIPAIDDPKTDAAVDDILTKEGDDLLAIQDAQHHEAPTPKHGFWGKIGHLFVRWWRNKWARWITILVLLVAICTVAVVPKARYAVLNTVGIRSSASVIVLDSATQLPLKNVTVQLGREKVQTDVRGVAAFRNLKLGDYTVTVARIAFAEQTQQVTIGWGSNPLGTFKLQATGIQYTLSVADYLSGKTISDAEVASEDVNALSDKNGKVILTVEDTDVTTLDVTVSAAGYRSEKLTLNANDATVVKVALVPAYTAVYVSKQSGKYDVYRSDLDGKNTKLLLPGTGNESNAISLAVSPDNQRAALVSTRDNKRDDDGFVLFALTIIDLRTGTASTVDHAQQIQLLDWVGDRLVYRMTLAGASAADSQRSRLISYNFDSNARIQLATANQFNTALSVQGQVYYAPSSSDPNATLGLFRIKTDGSGRKRVATQEVWTGLRTTYNSFSLQTPDGWYIYSLQNEQLAKSGTPSDLRSYVFMDNTVAKQSAWTDLRDGKGTLLLYDTEKGTSKTLAAQDGLTTPIRWAGDRAIVYRVVTNQESADYVISPNGGQPRRLSDVTATRGFGD